MYVFVVYNKSSLYALHFIHLYVHMCLSYIRSMYALMHTVRLYCVLHMCLSYICSMYVLMHPVRLYVVCYICLSYICSMYVLMHIPRYGLPNTITGEQF